MSFIWENKFADLKSPEPIFTVLIAAAGSGQRMGGVYKPLIKLNDKAMIGYSLEKFGKSDFVKQIVVSAPDEHAEEIISIAKECGCKKLKCVVSGGATRAKSVISAFRAAFASKEDITPFIAVHDAARPLINEKIIDDVFFACTRHGAAVAATKVRDAIKRAGFDNFVTEEIERDGVWQIQTPQAFDTDIFHTALATLGEEGASGAVDDGAVVMRAGFKVMCVETGFANFKVTYPQDVCLAEAFLKSETERAKADE